MSWYTDRRVLAGAGALGAVVVAVAAALLLSGSPHPDEVAANTASTTESSNIVGSAAGGGLKVELGKAAKVESDTSVRCFVGGQFVGMLSAADCAQKNGVKPGGLDVGLDQSGAIAAAAGGGDTHLRPLADDGAATSSKADDSDEADNSDQASAGDTDPTQPATKNYAAGAPSPCRRFVAGSWRPAGEAVSLDACVHTLFDGRCPPPGQVVYGRWGALTLRASPGRVDASPDNRTFSPLAPQYPADCSIPAL